MQAGSLARVKPKVHTSILTARRSSEHLQFHVDYRWGELNRKSQDIHMGTGLGPWHAPAQVNQWVQTRYGTNYLAALRHRPLAPAELPWWSCDLPVLLCCGA